MGKFGLSVVCLVVISTLAGGQDLDFTLEGTILPDISEVPTLANGHIGFVVYSDIVHINGLYNNATGNSHRARIPNYSNVQFSQCGLTSNSGCSFKLHMKDGVFETTYTMTNQYKITQQIYAHRYYNRAIINHILVERLSSTNDISVNLRYLPGNLESVDLDATTTKSEIISGKTIPLLCFQTNIVEDPIYQKEFSKLCVAHTPLPPAIWTLLAGETKMEHIHVTTIGETESMVKTEMQSVLMRTATELHDSHVAEWHDFWEKLGISVGNSNLNKIIKSSLFYLISNLPSLNSSQSNSEYFGLSPGGIGKSGYQGHSFWDTEMWMLPPITLLEPKWSEDLLYYRFLTRVAALDNARNTGYKGLRYAWESAFTGRETTPDCCPEVVDFQHHIISDIAFAVKAHLAATNDIEWFNKVGCFIAYNTAKFWESRVTFNETTKFYDTLGIMGPDEDHPNVTNSIYSNVNAAINLYFGEFAGCMCKDALSLKDEDFESFAEVAKSLALLYDKEKDFHPQYEGYVEGTFIKQGDVILLGYPLQFPMDKSTRENDLKMYEKVTRIDGPAMTHAMHTIGFLDLKLPDEAGKMFEKTHGEYIRRPFYIWSEARPPTIGVGNFITGAGGFLQSIINGYGGIRLHFDRMEISNFYLPPSSTSLKLNGITYLGNRFSLELKSANEAIIIFKTVSSKNQIIMAIDDEVKPVTLSTEYKFTQSQLVKLSPKDNKYGSCELKETVLGVKASGNSVSYSITFLALSYIASYLIKLNE